MSKAAQKTLTFPMAGVSRSRNYREQVRPYAAPWAVNVRGVCSFEGRLRGGSRPGLVKVHDESMGDAVSALAPVVYMGRDGARREDLVILADGECLVLHGETAAEVGADLQTDGGVSILAESGDEIVFDGSVSVAGPVGVGTFSVAERFGKLLIADSVLKEYDPLRGVVATVTASAGVVPEGCPLVALYRDRVFLAGANHVWYASRQGDPTDWHFGADASDVGRAVAGQLGEAGRIGSAITAMIPVRDGVLLMATANGLWTLRGDPATGTLSQLSTEIGILSPTAWARSPDGLVAFLSNDGVYLMGEGGGESPKRFSAERVPESLLNVDATANAINVGYDVVARGFHLFVTPASGLGQHWFLDVDNKALWPVVLNEDHQPVAVTRLQGESGLAELVMAGADGVLRKFSDSATDDDGEYIPSHVLVGPFRMTSDDTSDALLTELHGVMAAGSGDVTWRVMVGTSAEAVVDAAVAGVEALVAGLSPTGVAASGTWVGGLRAQVDRPRVRGPWAIVWLAAAEPWAYEALVVGILQQGRLR